MKDKITEPEQVNAFVDGELTEQQRKEVLTRLGQDTDLRKAVCDLHHVRDLLNLAYPLNDHKIKKVPRNKRYGAIAASFLVMLVLGFLGGYFSSNIFDSSHHAQSLAQISEAENKVIIYLGHSDKGKFTETLDKAESLLKKYKKAGSKVYVVTSAGGIDLLRTSGQSEVKQRIKLMSGLYKSLRFVACNNQIYQLHKKGEDVNLVKETEVAPSAVQFVVDHLQKGWTYIAI